VSTPQEKAPVTATAGPLGGTLTIGGDVTIHRLGFGAMRLCGPGVWGESLDPSAAKRVLTRAVELGITLIDTADAYGPEVNERFIAETLYPYPDELVVATKGGLTRPRREAWNRDGRPEHLRAVCEGSLRRLKLQRIDLYQLHAPDPAVPLEESVGALAELQAEGKIRHIGLSNVNVSELRSRPCRTGTMLPTARPKMCLSSARKRASPSCPGTHWRRGAALAAPVRSTGWRSDTMLRPSRSRSPGCLPDRRSWCRSLVLLRCHISKRTSRPPG
jgi:Aldo/keto reductase family